MKCVLQAPRKLEHGARVRATDLRLQCPGSRGCPLGGTFGGSGLNKKRVMTSIARQDDSVVAMAGPAAAVVVPDGLNLWATVWGCTAISQALQGTVVGQKLSTPLLCMLAAFLLASAGVIPTHSGVYDVIWDWMLPVGAALYLLDTDMSRLLKDSGSTFAAFVVGAAGTIAGTMVAMAAVGPLLPQQDGWKVACTLCASYIGGSVNFAATAKALVLSPKIMASAMAVDNVIMAIFLSLVSAMPFSWPTARSPRQAIGEDERGSEAPHNTSDAASSASHEEAVDGTRSARTAATVDAHLSVTNLSSALCAAVGCCAVGDWLARHVIAAPDLSLATTALVSCIVAGAVAPLRRACGRILRAWASFRDAEEGSAHTDGGKGQPGQWSIESVMSTPFRGSGTLAELLIMPFFVTIGASAGSLDTALMMGSGVALFAFAVIQLSVHLAVVVTVARGVMRLPWEVVLTASNANVGGPATAAGMAASRGWSHMLQPALMTGSFGYAIGTGVGLLMAGPTRNLAGV